MRKPTKRQASCLPRCDHSGCAWVVANEAAQIPITRRDGVARKVRFEQARTLNVASHAPKTGGSGMRLRKPMHLVTVGSE